MLPILSNRLKALALNSQRQNYTTAVLNGPVYLSMEKKLLESLKPEKLDIINESHLHAHHEPMQGVTNKETHFRVKVVSEQFEGKSLMQRHRMIYSLLNEEFAQGLHALALRTKTPQEVQAK
ncbi:BolA domain UV induced protein Uvi31 [Basidiobolus ranarum]|uniref:BolA domain UV induced protein Uvi31 n=1 Tax=Basidiobolus ranarum TaxID=34480 RepID=A0ABR2WYJ7_9FUNG